MDSKSHEKYNEIQQDIWDRVVCIRKRACLFALICDDPQELMFEIYRLLVAYDLQLIF